jgi:ribose-phosphate pyrophosphokinase
MSGLVFVPLPGNEAMAAELARLMAAETIVPEVRAFPDGESYFRLDHDLHGRSVALVCTMDRPDSKFLRLLFASRTVSELGAASVGLVAPYLCYMRQDRRFQPGEALTAKLFAALLSPHFDWLVTVDPHLHRIHALNDIYTVPTRVLHAAAPIAQWIAREVKRPVLIGPDAESSQWASRIAKDAGAPFVVLKKLRHGDTDVDVLASNMVEWREHTPVLVDDIVSTGGTMIETLKQLRACALRPAICIAVHGIFATGAYEQLSAAAPARIVTTNTIAHATNAIDVCPLLTNAIREVIA